MKTPTTILNLVEVRIKAIDSETNASYNRVEALKDCPHGVCERCKSITAREAIKRDNLLNEQIELSDWLRENK